MKGSDTKPVAKDIYGALAQEFVRFQVTTTTPGLGRASQYGWDTANGFTKIMRDNAAENSEALASALLDTHGGGTEIFQGVATWAKDNNNSIAKAFGVQAMGAMLAFFDDHPECKKNPKYNELSTSFKSMPESLRNEVLQAKELYKVKSIFENGTNPAEVQLNFKHFNLQSFENLYAEQTKNKMDPKATDKMIAYYYILNEFAHSGQGTSQDRTKAATICNTLEQEHRQKAIKGEYLDENSKLGKLMASGDGTILANYMKNSNVRNKEGTIDTTKMEKNIKSNVSLGVQAKLLDTVAIYNKHEKGGSSTLRNAINCIANCFKALVGKKISDQRLSEVAVEMSGIIGKGTQRKFTENLKPRDTGMRR